MQQTILALAAILIFSLYALSRHESDAGRDRNAITAEVETAASGVARERIHAIVRRAFDEADIGRQGTRMSTSGLTPRSSFGPETGEINEAAYDDLDDFDGSTRSHTTQWNGRDIVFRDSVSVRYIDPANPAANPSVSLAKEVTVVVRPTWSGTSGAPPVVARLRQVVTPASSVSHSTD